MKVKVTQTGLTRNADAATGCASRGDPEHRRSEDH
jgi:hypothetical protein